MTDPNPGTNDDPTQAELAALRKEKADREAAERAARDKELAELRAFKTEQEAKAAKAVKAPERRPAPATTSTAPATTSTAPAATARPAKPRGKSGGSRWWFGAEDE